jgi:putative hemolysin
MVEFETGLARAALVAARPLLCRVLRVETLRRVYSTMRDRGDESFESRVLNAFDMRFRIGQPASIPAHGGLVIAGNHPTGIRDGLVLLEAIRQVRPDVRILANHLLARIPELAGSCFFVDPFAGPAAAARSQAGLRAAHAWLRRGGALIVFPAGEVGCPDARWRSTFARLALATDASILPVYLEGRNSRTFDLAGRIHPLLRTLMLPREFLAKRGTTALIAFGAPLPPDLVRAAGAPATITKRVRDAVDALSTETSAVARTQAAIEEAIDPALLEHDVRALPREARLLASGAYDVFCATAASLPYVLPEIGRLREATFRRVGEGTGAAIDLDRFDGHYRHLFVWHRSRRQVVGAYRLALTDRVVAEHGLSGLYTRTLFSYDERLLRRLGPAIELGRSFVRAEYQREYSPLLLLWKGIGHLVAHAPRYRVLFGPVSISSRYRDTSQQLLRAFIAQQHGDAALLSLVAPVNPPQPLASPARDAVGPADLGALDALITRLEGSQGIPVLLRQYLRLNATLLGFSVDPAFGDALDALMMVRVSHLPAATLRRYLGIRDAARLLAQSGAEHSSAA